MPLKNMVLAFVSCFALLSAPVFAQPEGWTKPYPAFKVIDNLYGVGTYDLSVFLITTDAGHILINTGLAESTALIRENMVERILKEGDVIELGDIKLTVYEHPGHTEGSSSYTMQVTEGGIDYDVVIANMGTINPGKKLEVDPTYPGVSEDFASTYSRQKQMDVDVFVSAHGSQYGLHDKYVPGQAYSPDTFVDPEGFLAAVARLERIYLEQVAEERSR